MTYHAPKVCGVYMYILLISSKKVLKKYTNVHKTCDCSQQPIQNSFQNFSTKLIISCATIDIKASSILIYCYLI